MPRSISIARAHSECVDASYHLERGLAYLSRGILEKGVILNDPPLGEGLLALPAVALNAAWGRDLLDRDFYSKPNGAEHLAVLIAAWKTALFLPLVAVVFIWCRRLYGVRSGWLAALMVVADPNFAAHIPVIALDTLGATGIVVTCYLLWRYIEEPSPNRLLLGGVALGAAMMLKHTAVILPAVAVVLVALWWMVVPWVTNRADWDWSQALRRSTTSSAAIALVGLWSIWAFCMFEVTPPLFYPGQQAKAIQGATDGDQSAGPGAQSGEGQRARLKALLRLTSPWPAGLYLHSLIQGIGHGSSGHPGYLWGERRNNGWWYYGAVLATYKVPVGFGVVFLIGVFSLYRTPPRLEELPLFVVFLAWMLFLMSSGISIGFRHFLAPYAFVLMLSSRVVAGQMWPPTAYPVYISVVLAAVHSASYHPDYLSYFNAPRAKPHLAINDSNVDWGQSLKQIRHWMAEREDRRRPVSIAYFPPFGRPPDGAVLPRGSTAAPEGGRSASPGGLARNQPVRRGRYLRPTRHLRCPPTLRAR